MVKEKEKEIKKSTLYIDSEILKQMRVLAINQGKKFYQVAEEAFREYIENKGAEGIR